MRVRIGDYWLAGNPFVQPRTHTECANFVMTPVRIQQQVEGWAWPSIDTHDRGNQSFGIEFDTTREFDSFIAMMNFMATYPAAHDWKGAVSLREDGPGGTWAEVDLTGCTIAQPPMSPTGVSVRLHYRIIASAIGATRTGFYGERITEDGERRETEEGDGRQVE